MPMLRYSNKILSNKKYADLSALERLTLIELTMFSPMRIDEAEELLGNREATYEALYTKGYIAKNDVHFVVVSDLFKMDDINARVAQHRDVNKEKIKADKALKAEKINFSEMERLYNEIVAVPRNITQSKSMGDKKKAVLRQAWNFFKQRNVEKGRGVEEADILKAITTILKFASSADISKAKSLTNESGWVADINYVYRLTVLELYFDMARTEYEKKNALNKINSGE